MPKGKLLGFKIPVIDQGTLRNPKNITKPDVVPLTVAWQEIPGDERANEVDVFAFQFLSDEQMAHEIAKATRM